MARKPTAKAGVKNSTFHQVTPVKAPPLEGRTVPPTVRPKGNIVGAVHEPPSDDSIAQLLAFERTGIDAPPLGFSRRNGLFTIVASTGQKYVLTEEYVNSRFSNK